MATFLDVHDFGVIIDEADTVRRSGLACRLYADHEAGALDEAETRAALSIFRAIVRDPEESVRARFARFVAGSRKLTADLAAHMAGDVAEVATPVIIRSPALDDSALVDLAASVEPWRQTAVARRQTVSLGVAAALIEVACSRACLCLVRNRGAVLPRAGFDRLIARFPDHHALRDALLERPGAPATLVETHVAEVAERLSRFVTENGWLDRRTAQVSAGSAVDHALIAYAGSRAPEVLRDVAERWARQGRIVDPFLVRAAICGSTGVLEHALAAASRIPVARARTLIRDRGGVGFASLCARMGLGSDLESDLRRIMRARSEIVGRNPHPPSGAAVRAIAARVFDPGFMSESALSALGAAVVRDIARTEIERARPQPAAGEVSRAA
jgi:uncharacterized protein (DUF2336 family)